MRLPPPGKHIGEEVEAWACFLLLATVLGFTFYNVLK